ncbi:MAG: phosphatidate cytidylyltransferase [Gemmatimonadaceae bacterium]
MSNLTQRVLTAIVAIPIAGWAIYAGDAPFALLLAVLAGVGAWELYRIARGAGVDPLDGIGIAIAAAIPLAVHATRLGWLDRPLAMVSVVFVALIGVVLFGRGPGEHPLETVSVTLFGALYAGGPLSCAYMLRHHPWVVGDVAGTVLLGFPILITWATDIGAYTFGRLFGRAKLMPQVSPGKTRAGAYGGLALGIAVALMYNLMVLKPQAHVALTWSTAVIFGVVTAAAVQVGDLAESLFKRQGGVKDSSNFFPGHGGVLDRLDSLYFSLPVAYLVLGRLLLPVPS